MTNVNKNRWNNDVDGDGDDDENGGDDCFVQMWTPRNDFVLITLKKEIR